MAISFPVPLADFFGRLRIAELVLAPEAADNALQYKFSWSPRGVLAAGMNASRFLRDGKVRVTFMLILAHQSF